MKVMGGDHKPTGISCKFYCHNSHPETATLKPCEEYSKEADKHWTEVMTLAEKYGFILQAGGGVATLATHKNQMEQLGTPEYLRIQQMNGHCPKNFGCAGCLSKDGDLKDCGSCWAAAHGGKWVRFEKSEQYMLDRSGR